MKLLVYGSGIIFIISNALLMLRGFYYLSLLPVLLAGFYFAFFSLDKLFMAVVFLTPLSVELSNYFSGLSIDLALPTEPLIMLILLVVILRVLHHGSLNKDILYHPLSLVIILYLFWLLITTLTSSMPLVSLKFFIVRLWFISLFYFLAVKIFRRYYNIRVFLWCYMLALFLVVIYVFYRHADIGVISQSVAHWVVRPFYNDHTAYGAALAMFIPVLAALAPDKKVAAYIRVAVWILVAVFIAALILSYSRAAWLSIMAALGVWTLIRLKIRFIYFTTFSLVVFLIIFMLRSDIVREMEKNTQDSSANLHEHMQSVTNIRSDASNLERVNRWKCALAMYREKPLFGWGPGTYMFQYAPFQYSYDRTIISTNLADGGDAHSEYLGPLSETGLPGMLIFLLLAVLMLLTGFRLLRQLEKRRDRHLVTGILLGLITYLVHGIMNNFLHSDKAAVPFWGFAAILVAMDIYRGKRVRDRDTVNNSV